MGCSASRFDTLIAKAMEDPSPSSTSTSSFSSNNSSLLSSSSSSSSSMVPKTRSLSTPLVHHPAIKKGDTHHLVCLTSTTYGSLVVADNNHCSSVEDDDFTEKLSPDSVINAWELMEGLEDEENEVKLLNVDSGKDFMQKPLTLGSFKDGKKLPTSRLELHLPDSNSDFKVKSLNFCDFNDAQKLPSSKLDMNLIGSGDDYSLKTSKLDMNLVDSSSDLKVKSSNLCQFKDAHTMPASKLELSLTGSLMKLSGSYVFVKMPSEIVEEEVGFELSPSAKPLWKHLSEESLLSKMDPYVGNAYEKALSAKKLGFDQSREGTNSLGSSPIVSKSKNMGSTGPVVSEFPSYEKNVGRVPRCEDKIVLYFTSLRGIRKTYEDCSTVRMILMGFRVVVDERDISMDSSYRKELQNALVGKAMSLPQLFIRGEHIGGVDDVKLLHETGELESILEGCPTKDCESVCQSCGDARFVPCSNCYGSRKVFQEEEGQMRKCPDCNENGLVRCPGCCS